MSSAEERTKARKYRESVKHRFRGVCERCGEPEEWGDVEVHHVDRDRMNYEEDNLLILCHDCHSSEHMGDDPLWGLTVSMPSAVLRLLDAVKREEGYDSRSEVVARLVVQNAPPGAEAGGWMSPDESVSAWFGDEEHADWVNEEEVPYGGPERRS